MSQSRPKWNLNIFKHLHFEKGVKKKICCHQSWLCLFYFQWNFHEICARFQLCWGRNKWHGDGPITPQRPLQEWHVLFHEAKCLSNEATPLLLCCPTVVPCEHVGQKPNGWWFEITQVPFDKTPLIHCLNIITLISLKILSKTPLRSNDEPFSLSVQFTDCSVYFSRFIFCCVPFQKGSFNLNGETNSFTWSNSFINLSYKLI